MHDESTPDIICGSCGRNIAAGVLGGQVGVWGAICVDCLRCQCGCHPGDQMCNECVSNHRHAPQPSSDRIPNEQLPVFSILTVVALLMEDTAFQSDHLETRAALLEAGHPRGPCDSDVCNWNEVSA